MKTCMAFAAAIAMIGNGAFAAAQLEPGAQTFRKVLIEPARVELHPDFATNMGTFRGRSQRLRDEDARRIAGEMGQSFGDALATAFRARGFEIATAPGMDVLRISPSLQDLYVNAAERAGPASVKQYVREVGYAIMVAEGRDPKGARVIFATEYGTAGRMTEFNQASDVSNRFWFEAMFRRWADDLARSVARGR